MFSMRTGQFKAAHSKLNRFVIDMTFPFESLVGQQFLSRRQDLASAVDVQRLEGRFFDIRMFLVQDVCHHIMDMDNIRSGPRLRHHVRVAL